MVSDQITYDVIIVGGGPAGATAATDLAQKGHAVLLIDREGRTKPCGGAIPNRAIRDFDLPQSVIKARIGAARIVAPSGYNVNMEIGDIGYVGMVDREEFDPFLRDRAEQMGAHRFTGTFKTLDYNPDGTVTCHVSPKAQDVDAKSFRARVPCSKLKAVPSTKSRISSSFLLVLHFWHEGPYAQILCAFVMRILHMRYSLSALLLGREHSFRCMDTPRPPGYRKCQ